MIPQSRFSSWSQVAAENVSHFISLPYEEPMSLLKPEWEVTLAAGHFRAGLEDGLLLWRSFSLPHQQAIGPSIKGCGAACCLYKSGPTMPALGPPHLGLWVLGGPALQGALLARVSLSCSNPAALCSHAALPLQGDSVSGACGCSF